MKFTRIACWLILGGFAVSTTMQVTSFYTKDVGLLVNSALVAFVVSRIAFYVLPAGLLADGVLALGRIAVGVWRRKRPADWEHA